jgi:hypothetical protein
MAAASKIRFPSIKSVAKDLAEFKRDAFYESDNWCDVRLQVYEDGAWAVRYGDSQYDQDHRGYWGSSCIDKKSNCRDIAKELIDQAKDHASQCGGV